MFLKDSIRYYLKSKQKNPETFGDNLILQGFYMCMYYVTKIVSKYHSSIDTFIRVFYKVKD
jgi:hypothetical protein